MDDSAECVVLSHVRDKNKDPQGATLVSCGANVHSDIGSLTHCLLHTKSVNAPTVRESLQTESEVLTVKKFKCTEW